MNTREIILINVANGGVGLKDTTGRTYSIPAGGRLRISEDSFKNILDYPASRIILFVKKYIKVQGATLDTFLDAGLTDEQIKIVLGDVKEDIAPVVEEAIVVIEKTETVEVTKPEVVENESEEIKEETVTEETKEEAIEVKAITYYNWIGNNKIDKIKESLANPNNIKTLKGIIKKNAKYNTEDVKKLLAEVE